VGGLPMMDEVGTDETGPTGDEQSTQGGWSGVA
jgi:hypothetical protein